MTNKKSYMQLAFMIFLTLLTQVITLIKMSVIAKNFGASITMDAFNFTNNICTFVFSFISTGVTTVLIPAYIYKKNNSAINTFITIIYGVSLFLIIILFLFRYPICNVFAVNDNRFTIIAAGLMISVLLSQFTNTIIGVANAYLQANNIFNSPKFIVLIINLLLTALVSFKKNLSIFDYSYFILFTSAISMTAHVILIKKNGFKYKICLDIKNTELMRMTKIFIPTIFSAGLFQVTLLTDSLISTRLGTGQISILNYSNSIMGMINMLLATNLITFIYPKISKQIENGNNDNKVFEYFPLFAFIMILIIIGFIDVGKQGIALLYERGEFDRSLTDVIYLCTIIYSFSLPTNMIRELIYRALYAHGDTRLTFSNSVSASLINLASSIVLSLRIGIYGVILGTVLTSFYSLGRITYKYCQKYQIKDISKFVFHDLVKIFVDAIITLFIVFILQNYIVIKNDLLYILFYGVITVSLYFFLIFLFKAKFFKVKL